MELVDGWLRLWNGELGVANEIVTPDFRVHAAMLDGGDGSAAGGPDGLAGWVAQIHAAFTGLTFTIEVGPIAQDNMIALRWVATGPYAGGFPGAQAEPGTIITFAGTDILRIEDGRFAEYWVNSDTHVLLAQLKVG